MQIYTESNCANQNCARNEWVANNCKHSQLILHAAHKGFEHCGNGGKFFGNDEFLLHDQRIIRTMAGAEDISRLVVSGQCGLGAHYCILLAPGVPWLPASQSWRNGNFTYDRTGDRWWWVLTNKSMRKSESWKVQWRCLFLEYFMWAKFLISIKYIK